MATETPVGTPSTGEGETRRWSAGKVTLKALEIAGWIGTLFGAIDKLYELKTFSHFIHWMETELHHLLWFADTFVSILHAAAAVYKMFAHWALNWIPIQLSARLQEDLIFAISFYLLLLGPFAKQWYRSRKFPFTYKQIPAAFLFVPLSIAKNPIALFATAVFAVFLMEGEHPGPALKMIGWFLLGWFLITALISYLTAYAREANVTGLDDKLILFAVIAGSCIISFATLIFIVVISH